MLSTRRQQWTQRCQKELKKKYFAIFSPFGLEVIGLVRTWWERSVCVVAVILEL